MKLNRKAVVKRLKISSLISHEILLNFVTSFFDEYFKSSLRNLRYVWSICRVVSSLTEIQYLQNELSEANLLFVDEWFLNKKSLFENVTCINASADKKFNCGMYIYRAVLHLNLYLKPINFFSLVLHSIEIQKRRGKDDSIGKTIKCKSA